MDFVSRKKDWTQCELVADGWLFVPLDVYSVACRRWSESLAAHRVAVRLAVVVVAANVEPEPIGAVV